ncbi:MAG: tail fiber domain-containing protein, partial [Candidatus Yanofskybacteria bacterium]|nr:tail fiber domain-containing protein [Candidatus Yanofskybacteria bacterium]
FLFSIFLSTTFYILHSTFSVEAQNFIGPSNSAGVGGGAISVDTSYNIAVGTTTPQADTKLLIVGTSTGSGYFAIKAIDANRGPLFIVRSDGSVTIGSNIIQNNQSGGTTSIPSVGNPPANGALYVNGPIFSTLDIKASGLAVGTTTPQSGGDIYATGNINTGGTLSGANYTGFVSAANVTAGVFGTGNFTYQAGLGIGTSTTANLPQTLSVYGGSYLLGNVGIGNGAPTGIFQVSSSIIYASSTSGNVGIGTTNPATLFTVATSTNIFNALSNGRVGIGTANPAYTFDVNGTINAASVLVNGVAVGTGGGATSTEVSFLVHRNDVDQDITGNVNNLVDWTTEEFDTNNNFDLTANQFKPTVAGKYWVYARTRCYSSDPPDNCTVYIAKNGAGNWAFRSDGGVGSNLVPPAAGGIVDMNGTTDYLEVWGGGGYNVTKFYGFKAETYFTGFLIGGSGGSGGASTPVPSFLASKTSDQTVTSGVQTPINWNTEDFDTNSNFDLSTGKFTPTVAGKYLVSLSIHCADATGNYCESVIKKNTTAISSGSTHSGNDSSNITTTMVDMNGSSDYLQAYAWITSSGSPTLSGLPARTHFSATLIPSSGGSQWTTTGSNIYYNTGNVGIGTTNPGYKLDVNGTLRGYGITDSSDISLKKNIVNLENSLSKISQLHPVNFKWKDSTIDSGLQIGFVAQEMETIYPELVKTDDKGIKSINYSHLVAPLVEAVKELNAKFNNFVSFVKTEISNIKDTLLNHESRLQKLENDNEQLKKLICADNSTADICVNKQ